MKFLFEMVAASAVLMSGAFVMAEENLPGGDNTVGGERVARAPAAVGRNVVSRKRYPGGADEDDLQVQATLPIPSRTLDGSTASATPMDSEAVETLTPPPAND